MDTHKITGLIYDALMQNDTHEMLDLNRVINPEVEEHRGRISFDYEGKRVDITVKIN